MATGLVYDERFLLHDAGPAHPERPERLRAIADRLHSTHLWDQLIHLAIAPADPAWIQTLHAPEYVHRVRAACEAGERSLGDPDTGIGPLSYETALLAVGGVFAAVDAVMREGKLKGESETLKAGEAMPGAIPDDLSITQSPESGGRQIAKSPAPLPGVHNAFCAVRPPGHHAERDRAMGFCLFNNVALGAEYLLTRYGLKRVAIVDFDVHHGNGTQHLFESRSDVLFISLHEHPVYLYPGTGFAWETGQGPGKGFTLNIPLDPGSDDSDYRHAMLRSVLPALDRFDPQFLLLSAGFDASEHDPLAQMKLSAEGFLWMTRQLKMAAERHCGGRLVSVLEGGYDLRALSECVCLHVGALLQPEGHDDLMAMKAGF